MATSTVNAAGVTLIPFVPSATTLFTFTAMLTDSSGNSATYIFTTPYNIFGKRYYLTCTDVQGNHQFTVPLVGSPDQFDIPLTAGYFSTSVLYRGSTGNIEISDVALTGSSPGLNSTTTALITRPVSPDLSKIIPDLELDGTWDLDGSYVLDGKKPPLSS
ncbi:hypothetical protein [Paraburkholderia tropica]|uniref:hypothetical protein n=1 Tax=Paraburkholderia tropica TaxID=92647 RepID=UPI002AB1362C|nr:hypothetical protein [Paraburkholderia tropica]